MDLIKGIIGPLAAFAKKNALMFVIAIAIAAATLYYIRRKGISGFTSGNGKPCLYFVYATWCPHCKTVLPAIQALGSSVSVGGKDVDVRIIESEEKDKIKALGHPIEGYPTFVLQTASGMQEYGGERTVDAISSWIAGLI
jgi:thiol-disulfide isomerase/thioredoxin